MKFSDMKFLKQNGYKLDKMGWMRKWLDKKKKISLEFGSNSEGFIKMRLCCADYVKWEVAETFNDMLVFAHEYLSYRRFEALYGVDDTFKLGLSEVAKLIIRKMEICDEQ